MGSPAGLDPAAIAAVLSSIRTADNTGVSALAFLVFDHLLTFAQEVDLFWKPKLTGAAVIFLLNRYIVLGTMLLNVSGIFFAVPPKVPRLLTLPYRIEMLNMTPNFESCAPLVITTNVFAMLQYIPWAVFSAKRASALTSQSITFTALILLLSLTPVGAAISHFAFGIDGQNDPILGCVVIDSIDPTLSQRLTVTSRACLIFADALLILATWTAVSRTTRMQLLTADHSNMPTFGAVLLRDGARYFLVLLLLNTLHLTLTVLSVSEIAFQNASFVLQFVHPITGILVSHFLLDLQSTNRAVMHLDSASGQQMDTIVFGRAVFTLENATNSSQSFKDGSSDLKGMDSDDWSSVYSVDGVDHVAKGRGIESGSPGVGQ